MQSNTAVVKTRKQSRNEWDNDGRNGKQRNQGNKHRPQRHEQRNTREEETGRW